MEEKTSSTYLEIIVECNYYSIDIIFSMTKKMK